MTLIGAGADSVALRADEAHARPRRRSAIIAAMAGRKRMIVKHWEIFPGMMWLR